jgi:GT2 family glycosyltransferase
LSTIARYPLTLGQNQLSDTFARVASVVAWFGDAVRRIRYRRADLRRLAAVEMISERPSLRDGFRWLPAVRVRGRSHVALRCHPNARVTYDVTLPSDATVLAWCSLAPEAWGRRMADIEFEILVRTQGAESSTRRVVSPAASWRGRKWQALQVHSPEAGPARIVLTTRCADDSTTEGVGALWGSPRIEAPRSVAELVSVVGAKIAVRNLRGLWHSALPDTSNRLYRLWTRETEPSRKALAAQRQWSLSRTRCFSLITLVTQPASWSYHRTASTVQAQTYPGWEWILVAPVDSIEQLARAVTRIGRDDRVRVLSVPSGASRADAWNAALRAARGEWAALLGEHDALAPAAIYQMAEALERFPEGDLFYADEDRISPGGFRRHEPRFKPDWSPELLLSSNYIGRLALIRVSAAISVGGFRDACGTSEEWDLFLRLSRETSRIRRVPHCLYHREETDLARSSPDDAVPVLQNHFQRLGLEAAVTRTGSLARVSWDIQGQPTVSIVIPNRNAAAVLKQCVTGLLEGTSYPRRELVIVDNASTEPEVLALYESIERGGHGRIVDFDRPFNFSAACNAGAAVARGELLLFLNNDIEVIHADWLEELIRWAQRPDVGIVGAQLLYPDRTIQHAGVVFGLGLVGHIFARASEGESGVFGSSDSYRNYLAVTGACQMMRKDVFRQLGGYDERFRLSFQDVVLCMEAWTAGYRVVYTPFARLVHHESYTRKREDSAEDMELLARYLRSTGFVEDPYCHPELDPKSLIPTVRPPFDPSPRQVIRDYVDRVLAAATP